MKYPDGSSEPSTKFLLNAGVLWVDTLLERWPMTDKARQHLREARASLWSAWVAMPAKSDWTLSGEDIAKLDA